MSPVDKFRGWVTEYAAALDAFRRDNHLPPEWFAQPDHLAVKCADAEDYDRTVEVWMPFADSMSYVKMDGRRLCAVELSRPVTVGDSGVVEWLEILESRPERLGKDVVGIDYMEFHYSDFDAVGQVLTAKGIPFVREENPRHKWLSIMANGHEFKLNDSLLPQLVKFDIECGDATVLK